MNREENRTIKKDPRTCRRSRPFSRIRIFANENITKISYQKKEAPFRNLISYVCFFLDLQTSWSGSFHRNSNMPSDNIPISLCLPFIRREYRLSENSSKCNSFNLTWASDSISSIGRKWLFVPLDFPPDALSISCHVIFSKLMSFSSSSS